MKDDMLRWLINKYLRLCMVILVRFVPGLLLNGIKWLRFTKLRYRPQSNSGISQSEISADK